MKVFSLLLYVVFGLCLTGFGLAGGWYARSQTDTASKATASEAPAQEDEGDSFTHQAYKNMGVTWAEVEQRDYIVCREIPAVVVEPPAALRSVTTPWSGTVISILPDAEEDLPPVYSGLHVLPDSVLMKVLRAPLPLIDRTLTGEIVQSVSEAVHEGASDLFAANKTLDVAKREWERVKKINQGGEDNLPVIPRQTEINLQYDVLKAQAEVDKIRSRLYLHGLTDEHIKGIGENRSLPRSCDLWRRALARNGLWPQNGAKVLALLPKAIRNHHWTCAALGELNALGRCDESLLLALEENPSLGESFHELTALIQSGHSLPDVVRLHVSGALDPVILVRVPDGAPAWELREMRVKPGQKVEAGDVLAMLFDGARMILELEAPGRDAGLVDRALADASDLTAVPMVEGSGPELAGLSLTAYRRDGDGAPRAYCIVKNESLDIANGALSQRIAWRLRAGMRYKVRLPVKIMEAVFVLPREAVVPEGPDRVVYIRTGERFRRQPVVVLYEDYETVVCANDGSLFPGDPVVMTGAFPLCLALKATGEAVEGDEHKHGPS